MLGIALGCLSVCVWEFALTTGLAHLACDVKEMGGGFILSVVLIVLMANLCDCDCDTLCCSVSCRCACDLDPQLVSKFHKQDAPEQSQSEQS